jgi:hypothetical protein
METQEHKFYSTMDRKRLVQRAAEAACGWDFIEDNIEVDDRRGLSHIHGTFA